MNAVTPLLACATCFADPSSDTAKAMSIALIFMVAVVFSMLGLFIKIMFNFARKEREANATNPLP